MNSESIAQSIAWLSAEDQPALALCWGSCEPALEDALGRVHAQLGKRAIAHDLPAPTHESILPLRSALCAGVGGNWQPLAAALNVRAARWSRSPSALADWHEGIGILQRALSSALVRAHAHEPRDLEAALHALQRVLEGLTSLVVQAHNEARERSLALERQGTALATLRFSRLADSGIIGILVCDLDGNAREANDGFLEIVGYTRDDLVSGRLKWTEMTPPEWREADEEAVEQLKQRGSTRPWEKEYYRKDGSRVPILVGVAMLGDSDCVAYVLDISERKRAEELRSKSAELEAHNLRIQEASRLKSEFLANMSHELRTPLNSIIGFADLLYDGEVSTGSPQHQEFVGDILKSGRHLLQLINDVLDLAKVESGTMDFRAERVSLTAVIHEVCTLLRTVAHTRRIRLDARVDVDVDDICTDPARLKQVLYNYISNALKFTANEGSVLIRARAEPNPALLRLEVVDTGIGIAPEDQGKLFVEFQQLSAGSAKRHPGTGLGLALTKRIVEAQGGHVGVTSEVGKGSTFFAVLPRESATSSEPRALRTFPHRQGAATVLVVDDDLRDRTLIANTLDHAGYGVETAVDGAEAVAFCNARAFDAVTLDLILPDINGLEVLGKIRRQGMNTETPVLIVSVVAEKGVVAGFPVHDYLPKPIDGRALVASLERAGIHAETSGTILVVDDDPSATKLMNAMLQRLGYVVECSNSGEGALSATARFRPRAIILDLLMPGVDGFQFLERFRSVPENQSVPVIVWTTKDLTSDDRQFLARFSQGVFSKGQGGHPLIEELNTLLSLRRPATQDGAT